jgi:tetrahydromethanopterin S-methyltransferase subunit G
VKYINPKDIVEFWDEKNPTLKCRGYILGRTADYLMVKIPEIKSCTRNVYFTAGAYFRFYSEDFKNNILMGREVVSILLKKRLAISSQMDDKNKDIVSHQERVNAINSRYQSLREKLDLEWKKELHALEEDKVYATRSFKDLEQRLDEIDQKLELYKVKDENLTLDRWSLDSRLYFKK